MNAKIIRENNTFESGGLVAGTCDEEGEKEREEKNRSKRRAHRWFTHFLSLTGTVKLLLRNEEGEWSILAFYCNGAVP